MQRPHDALIFAGLALLTACTPPDVIKPYRMDIQQGNYISQDMVSQLKVGMTKEQVRYVLGTPLVADIFHADRWDYIYYKDPRRGAREERKIAVVFEQGKLARVLGEVVTADPKNVTPAPKEPAIAPQPAPEPARPQSAIVPAKPAADAPRPVAETPKPVAEAARPADEPAPTVQNWRAASDEPAQGESPKEEVAKDETPKAEIAKPEQQSERGFFGRILEKLGL